jgi:hypothetical protein
MLGDRRDYNRRMETLSRRAFGSLVAEAAASLAYLK